jgi:hypothetical protein
MKTRFIRTALLIPIWEGSIKSLLFPDVLVNELMPESQLYTWGDNLPVMRNDLRLQVDEFVDGLFDFEKEEELWQKLRETDPRIVSLYYDRLNVASIVLRQTLKDKEAVEIPESWPTFVALMLYQRWPQ